MNKWYNTKSEHNDVILSTRVRLARNLEEFPFPCRLDSQGREKICHIVRDALSDVSGIKLHYIEMKDLSHKQAVALAERHIISPEFASPQSGRALLLSDDESVSIMLCEEDHIRIQVIKGGLDLEGAFDLANKIDDLLDPEQNIMAGTNHLKRLQRLYSKSGMESHEMVKFTLAAYNAGEGRIADCRRFADVQQADKNSWESIVSIIPLMREDSILQEESVKLGKFEGFETIAYIDSIMSIYDAFCKICPES